MVAKFNLNLPVFVDSMQNPFNAAYAYVLGSQEQRLIELHAVRGLSVSMPSILTVTLLILHTHTMSGALIVSRCACFVSLTFRPHVLYIQVELDVRRAIRPCSVSTIASMPAATSTSFPGSKDLFRRLNLNRAVTLTASTFNTTWRHYDRDNRGFLPRDVALLFIKELADVLEVDYNEDRAMVIIESCNSPTNELSKKLFERVRVVI